MNGQSLLIPGHTSCQRAFFLEGFVRSQGPDLLKDRIVRSKLDAFLCAVFGLGYVSTCSAFDDSDRKEKRNPKIAHWFTLVFFCHPFPEAGRDHIFINSNPWASFLFRGCEPVLHAGDVHYPEEEGHLFQRRQGGPFWLPGLLDAQPNGWILVVGTSGAT